MDRHANDKPQGLPLHDQALNAPPIGFVIDGPKRFKWCGRAGNQLACGDTYALLSVVKPKVIGRNVCHSASLFMGALLGAFVRFDALQANSICRLGDVIATTFSVLAYLALCLLHRFLRTTQKIGLWVRLIFKACAPTCIGLARQQKVFKTLRFAQRIKCH